jgi:RNA polymerase sigma-70 factor, ECF subfamily
MKGYSVPTYAICMYGLRVEIRADSDLRDPLVFESAFELYRDSMLSAAFGVLRDQAAAEDLVQDIFIQLWLAPDAFDARRGSLKNYLVMLTRSRAIDRWRTRAVARAALERSAGDKATDGPAADDAAEEVIRRDRTRAAVAAVVELPRSQRDALLMAYGGGYSAREVAAATGTPLGTVKSRLRLGLNRARQTLGPRVAA